MTEARLKCDWNEKQLRKFIVDLFMDVSFQASINKKAPPFFNNLGIKSNSGPVTKGTSSNIVDLSVDLCNFLESHEETTAYRQELLAVISKEKISGEVFLSLSDGDVKDLFNSLPFGFKRSIVLLIQKLGTRNEEVKKETKESGVFDTTEPSGFETLRHFDKPATRHHAYMKGRSANLDQTVRGNMIHPIHRFVNFENNSDFCVRMAEETVAFSAACMNERRNGTIYFGISPEGSLTSKPGEIIGCRIEKSKCTQLMRQRIKESFAENQLEIVKQVIRDPQFINVNEGASSFEDFFVVEVDVVPTSMIVHDEVFSVKSKYPNLKKAKSRYFRFIDGEVGRIETPQIPQFTKSIGKLTLLRKNQEASHLTHEVSENQFQKFLNLLTGGSETMEDDVFLVVLFSPLDDQMDSDYISTKLTFVREIDSTVVFDFDPGDKKGLYNYVANEGNVVQVLTTDNFDKKCEENSQRDKYSNFLEELKFSPLKQWVFCNGYDCLEKKPNTPFEWKQHRIEGFRGAIQFYHDDIPEGRALVLVFLFSGNYEVMLQAADDVFTKFKDQWIVIAETKEIAEHWRNQMIERNCADLRTLNNRCIIGIPWNHINEVLHQVIHPDLQLTCKLPASAGFPCQLREKVRQDMCDLDILSMDQCNHTDIASDPEKKEMKRRTVEETFFRGGEVDWWNFWYSDDHVLKRACHKNLMDEVIAALTKSEEADDRVGVVTLLHQPGAGGTTSARQVLWELKDKYRCCVVKRITDQTSIQITNLRCYEDHDQPKPILVLIDNEDDERVSHLYAILENKARMESRNSNGPLPVFCVLLICRRKARLPIQTEAGRVQLKHELTRQELNWLATKNSALEKKFKEDKMVNPKHLISFNILKENFNPKYIKRIVRTFVKDIQDEKEITVLKFLSLLNTYDDDFTHVPVVCFDAIMQNRKKGKLLFKTGELQREQPRQRGWETCLSSSLRLLLNISSRSNMCEAKMQKLRIINYMMAKEILNCLLQDENKTIVDIMNQLLDSEIFLCTSVYSTQLLNIVKNILKKRLIVDERKEKFSPFVLRVVEEDIDAAGAIMIKVFEMDGDAILAQQIARFYIHTRNWTLAEHYANRATNLMYRNSFIWDTYAMVYKDQLYEEYTECSKTDCKLDEEKVKTILTIAFKAIDLFRKEQEISESDKTAVNNAGYFGEIRVILLLLSIFPKFSCYKDKQELHKFLVHEKFIPNWISFVSENCISRLKSMQRDSLKALRRLEDEFNQLKCFRQADFLPQDSHLTRECLIKLKENLDNYFGEFSDTIPDSLSLLDAMEYRRNRVRTLGITTLAAALRLKEENLLKAFDILLENLKHQHQTNSFDLVTVLTMAIAYYVKTKQMINDLNFQNLIDWSIRLFDLRKQQAERPYLETFKYLVLFNLPTKERGKYKLCPSSYLEEAIKLWKETFHNNHPRQKDGERYLRKKDTTFFFFGNGRDMESIAYYEELNLNLKVSDRLWRTETALNRFRRMKGVLQRDGLDINMHLVSPGGNKFNISLPTSLPIRNKSLWQKNVSFVLGFGWSGLKAYDVTDEVLQEISQDSPRIQSSTERSERTLRHRSPNGTKILDDIMTSIRRTEGLLEQAKTKPEKESLKRELKNLLKEQDDLLGAQ